MGKAININFDVGIPAPLDSRTKVGTHADLFNIPIQFIGLKSFVVDEENDYILKTAGWVKIETAGATPSIAWGDITGNISAQTDLNSALFAKYDKTGGVISGNVTINAIGYGYNFVLTGSEPSAGELSIPDAPAVIGEQYGRENGAWTLIVPYTPPPVTTPTGLEYNTGLGWTLIDRVQANYAASGVGAIDLSVSNTVGSFGAFGAYSFVGGFENKANQYGTAFGFQTNAGSYGLSAGNSTNASGLYATSLNDRTIASGNASLAVNHWTEARSFAETVVGMFNIQYTPSSVVSWAAVDKAFVVGIGPDAGNHKDGLAVYKSGKVVAPELSNAVIDGAEDEVLVTKKWVVDNPATVGIFSAYTVSTIPTFWFGFNDTVAHNLGATPVFWIAYLECVQQVVEGGRTYNVGDRVSLVSQHNSENDDLRGVQIQANATHFTVTLTTIKVFGSSFSSGTNGTQINSAFWKIVIVGVV